MSIATTSMSSLISALKGILLQYQYTTLSKIRTVQRGVLPPLAVFPSVAILPSRETYVYGLSNSKYEVDREILIEVYDLKLTTQQSKDNTVDLIRAVKNIFDDNYTFSDNCYLSKYGFDNYGDTIQVSRGYLFMSSLTLTCRSRESFPTITTSDVISNNSSVVTIQDALLALLKSNKSTYYSTVNTIVDSPISPIPVLPAILLGAGSKSRMQEYPAATVSDIAFRISAMTQLFHKETSLNHNLSIIEGIKDVLQKNHTINGYCDYSTLDSIEYEQDRAGSNFVYNSTISMRSRVREYL